MINLAEATEQPHERILEQRDILAAIADYNNNTLATIERIYDYNSSSEKMRIMLGLGRNDANFIRSCSWRLNKLLGTDRERAQTLNNKLKSILDGMGNTYFVVWCDVDKITATK